MSLVDEIANGLVLPPRFIRGLASKASHAYKVYTIPKRNGQRRTISHPARPLKAIQRWIAQSLVQRWPVHASVFSYRPGIDIAQHAQQHTSSRYLLRLDFADFFPSITAADISAYLADRPPGTANWSNEDVRLFTSLVCLNGRLTIGAPTSPALSNALLIAFDTQAAALAASIAGTYTRYADDLFFSTKEPGVLQAVPAEIETLLSEIRYPARLRLNASKERHSSRRGRRQVTGIVLGSDGATSIGRHRKRQIRARLHVYDSLNPEEKKSLSGMIAFAMGLDGNFFNSLVVKYGREKVDRAWKGRP